jgi:predicted kinase
MTWSIIESLVPAEGTAIDWNAVIEVFPVLRHAADTPQDPRWHAEGDVLTHTRMVVDELLQLPDYRDVPATDRLVLLLAAILHDCAKWSTTRIDPVTGAIGHPGHSRRGAIDARLLLWAQDAPFALREAICRMIAVHQVPFYAFSDNRPGRGALHTARRLSWQLDVRLLCALAEADMRGRVFADMARVLDEIELFREVAREDGCYGTPRSFATDHTRVCYFRGTDVHPDYALHQRPGSRVVVMCGPPASGKNTWVEAHHPDLPVVSFDDAREALGLRYGRNEGAVAHATTDKAKGLLRQRAPFVWNATHLASPMLEKTLGLLHAYDAEVELVHLEAPRAELLRRNARRDTTLTGERLEEMLLRWEVPTPEVVHRATYRPQQEKASSGRRRG